MALADKRIMSGLSRIVHTIRRGLQINIDETGFARAMDNGAYAWERGLGEIISLATGTNNHDATGNAIVPADSILHAISWYITTAVAGAGTLTFGDGTDVNRFGQATTVTAGAKDVTLGTPWLITSAMTIRITTSANPTAGVVRVVPHYTRYAAPTS